MNKQGTRITVCFLLAGLVSLSPGAFRGSGEAVAQTGSELRYLPQVLKSGPTDWPTLSFSQVVKGLMQPTSITHAGDNSSRLFITEKPGRIRIVKNGSLLSAHFLDISPLVGNSPGGEQGLLSTAFPPGYGTSRNHFYVYYTRSDGTLVISRFRVTADPDRADPSSEEIILTIAHPTFANHNGGQLQFGPDGYLYIGTGDGGGGGDPFGNAQRTDVLLGKILRIDVEATPLPPTYRIPVSNPYVGRPGVREEIWALGLRNPWRFSFDRLTGDLFLGDVGQNQWEEVDFQAASGSGGENYGWNILEGNHCYPPGSSCVPPLRYVPPVAEYDHTSDCSITGGYVFRGPGNPSLQGIYFYSDICSGAIRGLRRLNGAWSTAKLTTAPTGISTFGEDQAGNLYLAGYSTGTLYQITSP